MKRFILFALVALSACQWEKSYHPMLSAQPEDRARYEADRQTCMAEARTRSENAKAPDASGAFGLVGYLYDKAANNQDDDYHKPMPLMADECLRAKGYKLAN